MELFTYDFTVENGDFDPSVMVKGDVKGIPVSIYCYALSLLLGIFNKDNDNLIKIMPKLNDLNSKCFFGVQL